MNKQDRIDRWQCSNNANEITDDMYRVFRDSISTIIEYMYWSSKLAIYLYNETQKIEKPVGDMNVLIM